MVGLLMDVNQIKAMELLEICVNHWFPSDVYSLFPERLKLACKCLIELFRVSFSSLHQLPLSIGTCFTSSDSHSHKFPELSRCEDQVYKA